jgi:hypothetical protein
MIPSQLPLNRLFFPPILPEILPTIKTQEKFVSTLPISLYSEIFGTFIAMLHCHSHQLPEFPKINCDFSET